MSEREVREFNHVPILEGRTFPLCNIFIEVKLSARVLRGICNSDGPPNYDPITINNWNKLNMEAIKLNLSRLHPEIIVTVVDTISVENEKALWKKINEKYAAQTITNQGRTLLSWECLQCNGNIEEYDKECQSILFYISGIGISLPQDIMAYSILGKVSRNSNAYDHIIDSMVLTMNSTINPQKVLDKLSELLQHKDTKSAFQKTINSEENKSSVLLTNSSNHYFLTIVDQFTSFKITRFLKNKSDEYEEFVNQQNYMENLHNRKIKKIITDRGGEFLNQRFKELSSKKGFQHNVAPPYTPEHNGIAEKANRMILDKERYLFLGSKIPHQYWAKAINTAACLSNIVSTPSRNNLSPHYMWTKKSPKIQSIRMFGGKVILFVPKVLLEVGSRRRSRHCSCFQ
ncbi:hypothetical protein O181_040004 [Austropuccinia psidii MF-1]|uniref:Integrase catalytic domain-containing protein n=1 Tax=Austropuccinia psidii MF-1 TaxID=1389203 RepID=A0A9Q3HF31_9BASI|nr:hypothetical protein [Austropuccinia psidii MF-1]